jgi:hypothetical protein
MILEEKNHFFKNFFSNEMKWYGLTSSKTFFLQMKGNGMDWLSVNIGGGCIFWNRVMHANMAKP